jgi:hypothetical protein
MATHQAQRQATQGQDLSTPASLRALRAPDRAWGYDDVVGGEVNSRPRARVGEICRRRFACYLAWGCSKVFSGGNPFSPQHDHDPEKSLSATIRDGHAGEGAQLSLPISDGVDKSLLKLPEPRRIRNKEHLRFIAQQACLVCGRKPSDAHHLRQPPFPSRCKNHKIHRHRGTIMNSLY